MIVKMIKDLRNRMEGWNEKLQEKFNKDLKELKNKQREMNKKITEMKNTLEGISSRITEAEEWISDLEDRMVEISATEQNKEKRMKRIDDSLRDLWDNIKCTNIWIIGVPKEEEKEKVSEKTFEEIIVENFPNTGKEIVIEVQEAQRVSYRINPRRNTLRHILIKLPKIKYKGKNIKSNKGKATNNIQGNYHKVISWFFSRNSAGQKGVAGYICSDEGGQTTTKNTLPSKALIQIQWRNQKLYGHTKAKIIQHHQTSFTTVAKGTSLEKKEKRTKEQGKKKDLQKQTQNN